MSYGFLSRDASGNTIINSDHYGFALVDVITVNPTTSGSRSYEDMSDINVVVAQLQLEPTNNDFASLWSLNSVNISVYNSGTSKVVAWSPRFVVGTQRDINLYVVGL